jgi:hypothetical protein
VDGFPIAMGKTKNGGMGGEGKKPCAHSIDGFLGAAIDFGDKPLKLFHHISSK